MGNTRTRCSKDECLLSVAFIACNKGSTKKKNTIEVQNLAKGGLLSAIIAQFQYGGENAEQLKSCFVCFICVIKIHVILWTETERDKVKP